MKDIIKKNPKEVLSALWIVLIINMIYHDIFSIIVEVVNNGGFQDIPGEVIAGFMRPIAVSQMVLVSSGVLMVVPILVIIVCLFAKAKVVRWVNMIASALYAIVGIGNLVGETWIYYWIYSILEITVTIGIMLVAMKWTKERGENNPHG